MVLSPRAAASLWAEEHPQRGVRGLGQPLFGAGMAVSAQTTPYSALRHRYSSEPALKRLMSSHRSPTQRHLQ